MNQLSWLLYFADLSSSLSTLFGFLAFIVFICGFITFSALVEGERVDRPNIAKWFWFLVFPVFVLFAVISIALPSRDTVLAIAASEMGEEMLNTPTAGRVGKALEAWVNEQLEPASK